MERKNIYILIGSFLPGYKVGGPQISILNLIEHLSPQYDLKIITSNHDFGDRKPYPFIIKNKWYDRKKYSIMYIKQNAFGYLHLLKEINKENNENAILYLNSLFNPFFTLLILISRKLNLINIKLILITPRGELYNEALLIKPLKKKIALWFIMRANLIKDIFWHATSIQEFDLIKKKLNVITENIFVAPMIPSYTESIYESDIVNNFDLNNKKLNIIYLARISKDKNLEFALKVLNEIKFEINFDIYGHIEDNEYWKACNNIIRELPKNIIVSYLGYIENKDVKKTLSKYDLMFMPTFAENFGHTIAESLLSGTPVLISDNTPWKNLERRSLGWDFPLSNSYLYINKINELAVTEKKYILKFKLDVLKESASMISELNTVNVNLNLFNTIFEFNKIRECQK